MRHIAWDVLVAMVATVAVGAFITATMLIVISVAGWIAAIMVGLFLIFVLLLRLAETQ